jgi:sugar lactone lactonase YvrE
VRHAASLFVDCRCTLGEGIVWWARHRALLWTDIEAARLWMQDEGGLRSWELPARLGSLAPCESGGLLLGLEHGLVRAEFDRSIPGEPRLLPLIPLVSVEVDLPSTRLNDGRTDRAGNFVFGTMNQADGHPATGSFYQWSARSGLRRLALAPVGIANSICFSPDGGTMYFCDSPQRRIMTCRYDAASATVSDVREFATLSPSDGQPDGSIVDADGYLWNAAWGASVVRRYRPDGSLDREIAVPAKNPTCPVFGGAALNELFITSAREEMSPGELELRPDAGGVYRALVEDVRGLQDPEVADSPISGA